MPNMANVLDNPPCHPMTEPIQHRENLEVEAVTLGDAMHMTMLSHETSLREEPRLLSEVNQPLEKHKRQTKRCLNFLPWNVDSSLVDSSNAQSSQGQWSSTWRHRHRGTIWPTTPCRGTFTFPRPSVRRGLSSSSELDSISNTMRERTLLARSKRSVRSRARARTFHWHSGRDGQTMAGTPCWAAAAFVPDAAEFAPALSRKRETQNLVAEKNQYKKSSGRRRIIWKNKENWPSVLIFTNKPVWQINQYKK